MSIRNLFPYFGEVVIAKILSECEEVRKRVGEAFGFSEQGKPQVIGPGMVTLFIDSPRMYFDPYQTLDLAILVNKEVIPFEIKLGYTNLTKERKETWLEPCKKQKNSNDKLSGNMLAVLNRLVDGFDENNEPALWAKYDDQEYRVTQKWGLIARDETIKSYRVCNVNQHCKLFGLKTDLLGKDVGPERFNEIVCKLLNDQNYYQTWIGGNGS
ncbi:MAG: hypothetical protein K2X81_00990 [Candidatus Obscuribacterales bacterium]|nr:hypothetical protein [Candidatus Obscuribacterales bacterium]